MDRLSVLLVVFVALAPVEGALPLLSNVFGSGMVLQRAPAQARLWGWTTPNSPVNVTLQLPWGGPSSFVWSADASGKWMAYLQSTPATSGPSTITVQSEGVAQQVGTTTIAGLLMTVCFQITDVLFGDVIVCGGQSNMQFTLSDALNATEEIKDADNYPNIRVFTVGQNTSSSTPLQVLKTIEEPWSTASSKSVGGKTWTYFSAVCWLYGKYTHDEILGGKVPVGLISTNWGGTQIQLWSSPAALKQCNQTDAAPEVDDMGYSSLYNAMIVPFAGMAIKSAVWYQGEANTYPGQSGTNSYACMTIAMVSSWRELFQSDFPFLYVQLAPWPNAGAQGQTMFNIADMRQQQFDALLLGPPSSGLGLVTAADLGDPTSPEGAIHPRNKQAVCHRLTTLARAIVYGEAGIRPYGPIMKSTSQVAGTVASVSVAVEFFRFSIGDGLKIRQFPCPLTNAFECRGFVMEVNGEWFNATGSLDSSGNLQVTVDASSVHTEEESISWQRLLQTSGGIATATRLSYAWSDYPLMTVVNSLGLPAMPFNTTVGQHRNIRL